MNRVLTVETPDAAPTTGQDGAMDGVMVKVMPYAWSQMTGGMACFVAEVRGEGPEAVDGTFASWSARMQRTEEFYRGDHIGVSAMIGRRVDVAASLDAAFAWLASDDGKAWRADATAAPIVLDEPASACPVCALVHAKSSGGVR